MSENMPVRLVYPSCFDLGLFEEEAVGSVLDTTADQDKSYQTRSYNLDAVIAVGYRVNSYQATQAQEPDLP